MVTLSVRLALAPSIQVSTAPLSCSRSVTVPVNVRVELRHIALSLSFSVSVTPVTGIGRVPVACDATTVIGVLNTKLFQERTTASLLQMYLSVPCVTTAQTLSELELLTIVGTDTGHC